MHLALFDRQGWIYDLSVSSRPVTAAPDKPHYMGGKLLLLKMVADADSRSPSLK